MRTSRRSRTGWRSVPLPVRAFVWLNVIGAAIGVVYITVVGALITTAVGASVATAAYLGSPDVQQGVAERRVARVEADLRAQGANPVREAHMAQHRDLGLCDCDDVAFDPVSGWHWR